MSESNDDGMGGVDSDFSTGLEPMDEPMDPTEGGTTPADTPAEDTGSPGSEPSIDVPRVAIGSKEDRDNLTVYIDPVRHDDLDDLIHNLRKQYRPKPGKLDVYAAVFYAGQPSGSDDLHDYLAEFGYTRQ